LSEQTQTVKNPYLADNMPEGGGLTRDIVVTSAKYIVEPMKYKDGSPVKDKKTGEQSYFVGLRLVGLSLDPKAEGKSANYDFSAGKKARPSADGEMLVDQNGNPAPIYKSSNLGRAIEGLRAGGFDPTTLYPKVSILVGAKITLGGSDQKGADGKVRTYTGTDGKVHNSIEWFPVAYNGGAGTRPGSNGAGTTPDELATKAEAAVLSAITESARIPAIRSAAWSISAICPALRISRSGLPRASTAVCTFVLSPPRERPIAWGPSFFGRRLHAGGLEQWLSQ